MLKCTWCETNNSAVAQLRQAALDAAVELDWTKNEDGLPPEIKSRAKAIIRRVFDACEALDSSVKPK